MNDESTMYHMKRMMEALEPMKENEESLSTAEKLVVAKAVVGFLEAKQSGEFAAAMITSAFRGGK